ncbi:arginine N-methyltransferase [Lecanosticta acicola]|uniref:Protein arginine N-methyltransferase n=1 Tax=Lecanosticta acicola TaxID=111012 RepID=A0AAI8YU02_9PEZI|nr:arginine N-methyltransferase [Lecanosticta acicola]
MDSNGFSSEDIPTILYVGQHESQRVAKVTNQLLGAAQASGYDLMSAPLTTEHFRSTVLAQLQEHVDLLNKDPLPAAVPLPAIAPLTPKDSDLSPEDSNSALIGVVSPWIDLGSPDPLIARISKQVFNLEVAYAAFCGVSNVLVHGPISGSDVAQYSRAILEGLGLGPYVQLQILMPMTGELELEGSDGAHLSELARSQYVPDLNEDEDETDSDIYGAWEAWNTIRTMCNYSTKLAVALETPRQLPCVELQSRWYSEPVRLLVLPRTSFLRNNKGFPVLSKAHQQLLTRFVRLRFPPWVLLADVDPIQELDAAVGVATADPTPSEAAINAQDRQKDPVSHLRYIRHLQQAQPSRSPIERFGQGYQDYIQSPLQPLTDNLESITYEVFEKDPVKYEWYEKAVAAALKDLRAKFGGARDFVVAVVGAGRGPLVTRALQASKSTEITIKCCAVEKNPNAHVLIQRRNQTDPLWNKQVLIYKSDMRTWPGPTINGEIRKVDILVSELLGSFADNELSPECLDGVQHVLHPDHGINIPQSYSAHLTPIATPRLYSDLLAKPEDDKWEVPAVVMLHQYDYLCTEPTTTANNNSLPVPDVKEVWSFDHPVPSSVLTQAFIRAGGAIDCGSWTGGDGKNEHNARSCKVSFRSHQRGVCHGLGGYFETVLYAPQNGSKKIELSTNPVTMDDKSKDMISWFPIFFPLKTPIFIPNDSEIEVSIWRQTDDRKVWYEWFIEVFKTVDKKKMRLAVSELHSSAKNGCLM